MDRGGECRLDSRTGVSVPRWSGDHLLSTKLFSHFDSLFSIFCSFDILQLWYFVLRYFVFRYFVFRYFVRRYFVFRYFVRRCLAFSIFCFSILCNTIFCLLDILQFDILRLRYSVISIFYDFDVLSFDILRSIFCDSIFCVSIFCHGSPVGWVVFRLLLRRLDACPTRLRRAASFILGSTFYTVGSGRAGPLNVNNFR